MAHATLRSQWTTDPGGLALRTMGETAKKAADTWTLQEWAGVLAARAGPRDYVGQLRELYDDINRRWRYVQEDGERVPGSARALVGHVLGAWYNEGPTCRSAEHCDVARTPWKNRGFGDCDDIATLIAAAAISMGMRPVFRVVRWAGGAHVSTMVTTPKGQTVNVDPVGEPDHKFGWELPAEGGGSVELFDIDGRPAAPMGGMRTMGAAYIVNQDSSMGAWELPTYMDGLGQRAELDTAHVVLTRPGDTRGPRVLAIPTWHFKLIARGHVEDGMPAIDQFGDIYAYDRGQDVWAPLGACIGGPMGRRRRRRRRRKFGRRLRRRARRIARRIAKVGRGKLGRAYRKVAKRLLKSKIVQEAAARGLQALGIPPQATKAVLAREAELARRGGRTEVANLIAQGKTKQAAALIAKATGVGIRSQVPRGAKLSMSGQVSYALVHAEDEGEQGIEFVLQTGGGEYPVAPVAGFERVGGWYGFGQLDVTDKPEPGRYYRTQKGDSFAKVTTQAYGVKGQARLKKMRVINNIAYNSRFHSPAPSGEAGYWKNDGNTRISFMPRYSCSPETQASSPTAGEGTDNCYPIMYFPVGNEEPPPYEPPPPPEPEPVEPEEPEEPTVEVPDEPEPEEPVEPEEPEEPDEPEPVTPAPAVEPKPPVPDPTPPVVEPPLQPTVEEPTTPQVVTCEPGYRYDQATQSCVPMCPEGYTYDAANNRCVSTAAPSCPPNTVYDEAGKVCRPEAALPPPVIAEPEPTPTIECPPGTMWNDQTGQCQAFDVPVVAPLQPGVPTVEPTAPRGGGGDMNWLLAFVTSIATGSPVPLIGAALMEDRK